MNMALVYKLTLYSGIAAIALLICTFTTGILEINFKLHKNLAMATFAVAVFHAGLVIYRTIKMRSKNTAIKK